MSAVPARKNDALPGSRDDGGERPFLKLQRCRLDYPAALRAHLQSRCAARVAIAAGSSATSRRNLRRVGLKIIERLASRYDVFATFDHLGYTLEDFCRGVIEQTKAMKTVYFTSRGRVVSERSDPDWRARNLARWLYLKATGIIDLPTQAAVRP